MFGLPLAFAAPAALAALAGLIALYWLLRVTPPPPRRQPFPPLRLMLGLDPKQTTSFRTPWPLLLLRLLIAALVILAMAGPIWRALAEGGGKGPLLIIVDDGFPAASTWERRIAFARETARAAARAERPVAVAAISHGGERITAGDGAEAETKLGGLQPVPYVADRKAALAAARAFFNSGPKAEALWIADGLEIGGAAAFAKGLKDSGRPVEVAADAGAPRALVGAESSAGGLEVTVARPGANAVKSSAVRAYDSRGRSLGEAPFDFGDSLAAKATFDLPLELRNDISRVAISGEASAGAIWLIDARAKRRRVALMSGGSADLAEPLLSPTYYVRRALDPYSDVREPKPGAIDPLSDLMADRPSVLALADMTLGPGPAHDRVAEFVENGGLLLRFAGPRLASGDDDLVPTPLRKGGRTLGGALSWETPKPLGPFDPPSPFVGLPTPAEVSVTRQVLAEPTEGLSEKTWAHLADGTPLVTAARRGKGLIVLFHVTADTTWSNLPLSGLFVEMLRRTVAEGGASPGAAKSSSAAATALPPLRTLDGFGDLQSPPATAKPLPAGFDAAGDAEHPPGFYGASESAFAVNALPPGATLTPGDYSGLPMRSGGLATAPPLELKPWLLLAAFLAFLADCVLSLRFGGTTPRRLSLRRAAPLALALLLWPHAPPAHAASVSDMQAATSTRLAYVLTGDPEIDETTRLGLEQLTRMIDARTSANLADPVSLDPAKDELAFYPLIYWPVAADRPQPPPQAVARIAAFMRNGGTVVFDTRDALDARLGDNVTPQSQWLRKMLAGVDVPELEPTPHDHVLTKTFYLLSSLVGRTENGQTWVEALPPVDPNDRNPRPARAGDSVSPIIITSNDFAGAWAAREDGSPLYPLVPGGPRQREMALRTGINLVMYALTGNYKADQVHAKDLLERLSR